MYIEGKHTIFIEEATATWCPYCPLMAEALNNVYESDDYPFYFVALVADENQIAEERVINDYNLYGYPTAFFDGGYQVLVGGYDDESYYRTRIERCGERDIYELNLSISVGWLGDGDLEIDIAITNLENNPPEKPSINGPSTGQKDTEYEYTFSTLDPDGDDLYYYIEWGDDKIEEWIGPYDTGENLMVSHIWDEEDIYIIRVKVKDEFGAESDWATLEISVPKIKGINLIFLRFLDQYPNLLPLLQKFLGL